MCKSVQALSFLIVGCFILVVGVTGFGQAQRLPSLSINDVALAEDSCQGKSFVFTITLSHLGKTPVTVNYATADGSPNQSGTAAFAGKDYVPVSGVLTFTHDTPPNGPQGSYVQAITVPLGSYLVSTGSNDGRSFTLTLTEATNATISKAQGTGTLLDAAVSCQPSQNSQCFVNFCGATAACRNVNLSATTNPYCQLAGIGVFQGSPDPNFGACGGSGGARLWLDTDGDGFSDAAESVGYIDVNANGVFDPGIDVPLPQADPSRPDVYLHYDYMSAPDHDHKPPAEAIQWMIDAFAARGVNLHIDPVHNAIPEAGQKVVTNQTSGPPDFALNSACAGDASTGGAVSMHALAQQYLPGNMKLAYHYMVFAHYSTCPDAAHCSACTSAAEGDCVSGSTTSPPFAGAIGDAEINGGHAIVSLGPFVDSGVSIPIETTSGVTMHELGHNFGLVHGGITSSGPDCSNQKPNYISVMNYSFATTGIPVAASPGALSPKSCTTDADCAAPAHCSAASGSCFRIDYSSALMPDLNENQLNEPNGLNVSLTSTDLSVFYTNGGITPVFAPTNGAPIDWNQDGSIEPNVCADISGESAGKCGSLPTLLGANDWGTGTGQTFQRLNFDFQCTAAYQSDNPPMAPGQFVFDGLVQSFARSMLARGQGSSLHTAVLVAAPAPQLSAKGPQTSPGSTDFPNNRWTLGRSEGRDEGK
jgi:hypothetical protein